MEYLFFYLLQITDSLQFINVLLIFILFSLSLMTITYATCNAEMFEDENKYYKGQRTIFEAMKKGIIIVIICIFIISMIPTKQTLLLCSGTYIGKRITTNIVNSDKFQKIDKIIELELDKRIKELTK